MDILSHVLKYHKYAQLLCTDAGVSIYWRNVLIYKYRCYNERNVRCCKVFSYKMCFVLITSQRFIRIMMILLTANFLNIN